MRSILEDGSASSSSRQPQQLRRSYSHVLERDFVGMEDETEKLAQELVQGDQIIVSIFGMGGLGKTTLAQKVHNHPLVKSHFDASAWVCISQEWDQSDILQSILTKLFPGRRDEVKKFEVVELVGELFNAQSTKKIIFVLDDIWEAGAWESIKCAFNESNAKILLTTRKEKVAFAISPNGFRYNPPLLDPKQSWELFQKKSLLKSGIDKVLEDFEALGKEMVKQCGGLPLAIIVLGGILATKDSKDEWKNVHDNIKYFLGSKAPKDDHHSVLDDILSLSYDDLPHRLKPCFLYMASFGEDETIDAELLYHMWMAEGLVSMEDRKGEDEIMINVAERYLGELVERCMVQVEARDIPMVIKFQSCRLHDIMRELCIKKARDENFLMCIDDDKQRSVGNVSRIRRFRMTIGSEKVAELGNNWPLPDDVEKHARSLQLCIKLAGKYGEVPLSVLPIVNARLKGHRLLKVLTIDGYFGFGDNGDDALTLACVGKLYHLRFLKMTSAKLFTNSYGKLKHLQTLDFRSCDTYVILKEFQNMRELRYLYFPRKEPILPYKVILPQHVMRLGCLHKLEVLENFDLRYCNAKDLSRLTNLVQLGVIVWIPAEQLCDAVADIFNNISYLGQLKQLSLHIGADRGDYDYGYISTITLSQLFQINKVPSKFLGVLKVLKLECLSFEQDCIGILETKLPNLQQLVLRCCKSAKEIRFHSNGFPQLKWLCIDLDDLEKLNIDEGAMSNLVKLEIVGCGKLEMIPDGLRKLTSLKELRTWTMDDKFNNRLLQVNDNGEEGADFHKISHIPSIKIDKW